MKRNPLFFCALLLFVFSCQELGEITPDAELRRLEYARDANHGRFSRFINDDRADIRLAGLAALGRIQDSSTVVLLANRLTNEPARVREAAVFALGQLQKAGVENYLVGALRSETDVNVRLKIIEALGKTGSENSFLVLRDFLQSMHPAYQRQAAIAHGILGNRGILPPGSNLQLLGRLMTSSPDEALRWRCAYALYNIASIWALPELVSALEDSSAQTRFFALKGIDRISSIIESDNFESFRKQNRNDPDLQKLLQSHRSQKLRKYVTAQLQDSSWMIRIAAIHLAGTTGNTEYQLSVGKLVNDPHAGVQLEAIRTLPEFELWYARRELRKIHGNAELDWRLRGEALAGIARLKPAEALKLIEENWIEAEWPQTFFVIKALESIETTDINRPLAEADDATRLLMQMTNSSAAAQQSTALEILTWRAKPPVETFFVEQLKNQNAANVMLVSNYISRVNGQRPASAFPELMSAWEYLNPDADLPIMAALITALDSLDDPRAIAFLSQQARSEFPLLRKAATRALARMQPQSNITGPLVSRLPLKWDFVPLSADSSYHIAFQTDRGQFVVQLLADQAPVNAANMASLARRKFFDQQRFHHVLVGDLVQGGEPRGDGWGGPGYMVPCEYGEQGFDRGIMGMAHAGKDTGGSQFFIPQTPKPYLNGRHTPVGKVVSGMDIVDSLIVFDQIRSARLQVRAKK